MLTEKELEWYKKMDDAILAECEAYKTPCDDYNEIRRKADAAFKAERAMRLKKIKIKEAKEKGLI